LLKTATIGDVTLMVKLKCMKTRAIPRQNGLNKVTKCNTA